jgi:hypothetical protein
MCSEASSTSEDNLNASQAMTTTLQNDYKTAFANNQSILGGLTTTLNNAVAKPQGFTSPQMAALRTGAMDTTTGQFNAAKANAAAVAARSGGDTASGVTGQVQGQLAGEEAATESGQQNDITKANAELQQQNYWKGISGLSQVASQYNPTGYASAGVASTDATTGAAKQVQSEQEQDWQNTFGVVKGIAGLASAAAGPLAGGIGNIGGADSSFGEKVGQFFSGAAGGGNG